MIRGGLLLVVGFSIVAGCTPERIEYVRRPSFYDAASDEELPDRVVLEDGTVIVYTDEIRGAGRYADEIGVAGSGHEGGDGGEGSDAGSNLFESIQQDDDGNVTLQAILPEHVVSNTLWCLRNEEYELLWEQMVADRTKAEYESFAEGIDEFAAYFKENRQELARTLNRMTLGWMREDVQVDRLENNVYRCRLRNRVGTDFQYTRVYTVVEGFGMKLLIIK